MAQIKQTLKLKNDPTTEVYPNILSDNIPANAVDATKIASNAIDSTKIADAAVTASKIGTSAVTEAKIASNSVTAAKIGSEAVLRGKIRIKTETLDQVLQSPTTLVNLARQLMDFLTNNLIFDIYFYDEDQDLYKDIIFYAINLLSVDYYFGGDAESVATENAVQDFMTNDAPRIYVRYIGA